MKKIGAYKILYDRQLIIEYYSGEITTEDLLFFKNAIHEEPNHNLYWNTVLDLRDCNLLVKGDELPEIIDFFKKNSSEKSGTRNVAYITSKPNEAALSTLYAIAIKKSGLNFNPNVFSTLMAVSNFIGEKTITEKELAEIINELKAKPNNVFLK